MEPVSSTPAATLDAAPPTTDAAVRPLGLGTKLAYGAGSIAFGIKDNGFSTLLLLFYSQVVGLRADLVGLAIMIALVLDAFIDPVIGHVSDHTRSRWGRRHPYMYAAAIPIGLLYVLLWTPPRGDQVVTMAYLIVVSVLVRTAISAYEVPSAALAPELTQDYHERTSVIGYRYLFGWIGGMGMLLLTFAVLLAPTPAYPVGQLNPAGYRDYAVIAATLMTAAILLSAFGTQRRIAALPRPVVTRTSLAGTLRGVRTALGNQAFRTLLLAGVFGFTAQGLTFALSTYFNTFFWGLPASILALSVTLTIAGVILAFALAAQVSRRVGKRGAAAAMTLAYPVVAILPYLGRLAGVLPANGDPWLLAILGASVLVATALGVGGGILSASMMADVVEDAQTRTGERTEGLFFAGSFFMQKCVSGLGVFLSGAILALVGFPAGAVPGSVPAAVLTHLVLIYCAGLMTFAAIAAWFLARFPLGGESDHRERLAALARAAARAAPLPASEPELQTFR